MDTAAAEHGSFLRAADFQERTHAHHSAPTRFGLVTLGTRIREALSTELWGLPSIHVESRNMFIGIHRPDITELPPISPSLLTAALEQHALLVANIDTAIVGFGVYETIGPDAYLHQLSVRPAHAGQGVGGRLLDALVTQARQQGHAAMTLITYDDVPWNGPFYRKHGFERAELHPMPAYLVNYLDDERRNGMDMTHRVAMRRSLR